MKKQIKVFFWALKCSFIISPLRFIFNLLLVIVSSVLPVALATYSGSVSEHIIELAGMGGEYKFIFKEIVILGLIFVMNKFLFYGSGIITSAFDIRINAKIKERLINVVGNVSLKEFDDAKFNDDLNLAKDGFESLLEVADNFYNFVGETVAVISTLTVIAYIFPAALLFIVVSFFIGYHLNMRSKKIQRNFWSETVRERRYCDYLKRIMTSRENAKEIRSLGLQSMFMPIWKKMKGELRSRYIEIDKESKLKFAQYQFFMDFINIIILVMAIIKTCNGEMQVGDIIVLWQLNMVALTSVQTINSAYSQLYYNNGKIEKSRDFVEKFAAAKDNGQSQEEKKDIVFRADNVSFSYNSGEEVLKNISLSIRRNQSVAIIGENGSGKSTLIKVLSGLYKPDFGDTYINGINTKEISKEYIQQNIGAAFQDFICYPFTLRENIGYGYIDKIDDDECINAAAKKGNISYILDRVGTLSKFMGKSLTKDGIEISGASCIIQI